MQSVDITIHVASFLDAKSAALLSATSTDMNTSLEGQFIHGVCKHCATRLELSSFSWSGVTKPVCINCRRDPSKTYYHKLETCPGCNKVVDVEVIMDIADRRGEQLSDIVCPRCEVVIDTEDMQNQEDDDDDA